MAAPGGLLVDRQTGPRGAGGIAPAPGSAEVPSCIGGGAGTGVAGAPPRGSAGADPSVHFPAARQPGWVAFLCHTRLPARVTQKGSLAVLRKPFPPRVTFLAFRRKRVKPMTKQTHFQGLRSCHGNRREASPRSRRTEYRQNHPTAATMACVARRTKHARKETKASARTQKDPRWEAAVRNARLSQAARRGWQ